MPLFKGCGCKAKPAKAIDYITDEKKAAIITSYALDDNRDYSRQFAETAQLFHKAQRYDSRKYYHFKHSFDPKDNISPEEAHRLTEELAQQAFPDNEYIIATHTDKHHVHCHIIVNSVSFVNGKMLHYSNSDYAKLKDLSNEIAAKYGYSTLDFRKPSADRIKSEERRVILKGGTSWKEELREVIAEALKLCNNMDEFEKHLNKYGVTIARNTAKTISFLHPNKKKPIRGSKLGPAREQLHNLNQQSKQELENSLLKEVLAEYTEQWKALKREQNSFLQQMTERMNDLTKTVAGQVTANQLLSQNLAAELNKLTTQLSDPLKDSYQRFATKTEAAEEQLSKQTEKYIRNMDDLISQTEERKNRFFTFNRIKSIFFWSGCVSVIILLLIDILKGLLHI